MKRFIKKENLGITLIALVITIIVLLILAGVTVATITGENGLLSKAQLAKEKNIEAEQNEKDKLSSYEDELSNYSATTTGNRDYESQISALNATITALTSRITELENANSYSSTSETRIGTWTDGKPLYRKVIYNNTLTSISKNTWTEYADVSSLHIESFVSGHFGRLYKGKEQDMMNDVNVTFEPDWNPQKIQIARAVDALSFSGGSFVVIEYTKTTDTAPTAQSGN